MSIDLKLPHLFILWSCFNLYPSGSWIVTIYSCFIDFLSLVFQKACFLQKYLINHFYPFPHSGRICSFLMIHVVAQFVLNPNDKKLAVSYCSNFYFYISPCFWKRYLLWTQLRFLFSFVRCMQHLKFIFFFRGIFILSNFNNPYISSGWTRISVESHYLTKKQLTNP